MKVLKLIEEFTGFSVNPEDKLREDLGLDSLAIAELLTFLEEELNRKLNISESEVDTVKDILEKIDAKGGNNGIGHD